MRWFGRVFPILAAAVALVVTPASAIAATATTYSDPIGGFEYSATSTQGSFAGAASGALPGPWSATVDHTPLSTSATITSGDFSLATYLHGGLRTPKLHQVATFGDGATLDVPGSPRVILTPGHTPGSAALHVASLGALFVGDAFATYAVTTGARGPQVAPFPADAGQAVT